MKTLLHTPINTALLTIAISSATACGPEAQPVAPYETVLGVCQVHDCGEMKIPFQATTKDRIEIAEQTTDSSGKNIRMLPLTHSVETDDFEMPEIIEDDLNTPNEEEEDSNNIAFNPQAHDELEATLQEAAQRLATILGDGESDDVQGSVVPSILGSKAVVGLVLPSQTPHAKLYQAAPQFIYAMKSDFCGTLEPSEDSEARAATTIEDVMEAIDDNDDVHQNLEEALEEASKRLQALLGDGESEDVEGNVVPRIIGTQAVVAFFSDKKSVYLSNVELNNLPSITHAVESSFCDVSEMLEGVEDNNEDAEAIIDDIEVDIIENAETAEDLQEESERLESILSDGDGTDVEGDVLPKDIGPQAAAALLLKADLAYLLELR